MMVMGGSNMQRGVEENISKIRNNENNAIAEGR